ncbi:ATP-dependent RNA helicase A-like [Saccostrea echinata]|uniref:ATP-dependent RNA helicase A-like n=1 Tax=Saccostrea echinata TaxID=191078 RepID=UPI002A7FF7D9|nr:ATP-dependent RNA helicase A-like [Saccostrea echinata]
MLRVIIALFFLALSYGQRLGRLGGNDFFGGDFNSGGREFHTDFNNGFDFGNQIGDVGGFQADFIGAPALGSGLSANSLGIDNSELGISTFDGIHSDRFGSLGAQGSGFSPSSFSSWDNGGFDSGFGQQDFLGGSQWGGGGNRRSSFTSGPGGFNQRSSRPSSQRRRRRPRY